ncbi:glycosyltransferase [Salinigranum halophilum]|uniref:glycosyltransferase n=1 Tax=Salinigranum halophilum TaxID=2565931 RepID=UPI001F388973|nr:glycosyltransferase [Salinigranum halophilum]
MTVDDLSIGLAHWHIEDWGGAEYLVTRLAAALDVERVYTLGSPDPSEPNPYGDVEFVDVLAGMDRGPLPRLQARFGRVFEYALWEDVDWRQHGDFEVLVTSGATTRAVITPDDVLHINYCHSPPRWFYDLYHDRKGSVVGQLSRPLVRHLRTRDTALDDRVDHYLVNSPVVQRRLWKFYKRESTVLYPPVDLSSYHAVAPRDFYLHLGRLDREKGVEAVVDAFAGTDRRLVLAGGCGDVGERVRQTIRNDDRIDYVGFVSDREKHDLLAHCRAVVFNGRNEDFGIVPIEANASGKACLVRNDGFPGIYVEDGIHGFQHDGTASGIRNAVERFERDGLQGDPSGDLEQFSEERFGRDLRSYVFARLDEFQFER